MIRFLRENGTFIVLLCLIIILSFMDSAFLTPRNLSNLARQVTMIGIISIGMTVVILIGGIDLSVGSVVAMSAVGTTLLIEYGIPVVPACIAGILVFGVLAGLWNGFWVARFNIPPFIITLGMMTMGRGIALVMSGGSSVPASNSLFAGIGGSYISDDISVGIIVSSYLLFLVRSYVDYKQKKKFNMYIHSDKMAMTFFPPPLRVF